MIGRCTNPNNPRFARYGGRKIEVCERWLVFENWLEDVLREIGPRPVGVGTKGRARYSLDRRENDGNYEPGNIRWATPREQLLNSSRARGGVK